MPCLCITDWVAPRGVMAITKCRIWVPPVNQFTRAETALRQCGRTSDWMVRAGLDHSGMKRKQRYIMQNSHYLDYDPVALAVLFLGLGAFGLFLFS
jgi:hypothetical protein